MYAGLVVESAGVNALFENPLHPYTKALFGTIPYLDQKVSRLSVIPGEVPNPLSLPEGCPFHPRCSRCFDRCRTEHPDLCEKEGGRKLRCFLYD
jgi:peptide/nickel transport system ATP-binding protein